MSISQLKAFEGKAKSFENSFMNLENKIMELEEPKAQLLAIHKEGGPEMARFSEFQQQFTDMISKSDFVPKARGNQVFIASMLSIGASNKAVETIFERFRNLEAKLEQQIMQKKQFANVNASTIQQPPITNLPRNQSPAPNQEIQIPLNNHLVKHFFSTRQQMEGEFKGLVVKLDNQMHASNFATVLAFCKRLQGVYLLFMSYPPSSENTLNGEAKSLETQYGLLTTEVGRLLENIISAQKKYEQELDLSDLSLEVGELESEKMRLAVDEILSKRVVPISDSNAASSKVTQRMVSLSFIHNKPNTKRQKTPAPLDARQIKQLNTELSNLESEFKNMHLKFSVDIHSKNFDMAMSYYQRLQAVYLNVQSLSRTTEISTPEIQALENKYGELSISIKRLFEIIIEKQQDKELEQMLAHSYAELSQGLQVETESIAMQRKLDAIMNKQKTS